MYAGVSLDKVIEAMGPKLDKPLTAEAIENSKRAAAVNLPDQLEGDDWVVLLQFASSPIRDKLQRVAPEFHQLLADIENEPTPQLDADIEKAVEATVSD